MGLVANAAHLMDYLMLSWGILFSDWQNQRRCTGLVDKRQHLLLRPNHAALGYAELLCEQARAAFPYEYVEMPPLY